MSFDTAVKLAEILMALSSVAGLTQLLLIRKDISTRNRRAARQQSVELIRCFVQELLPRKQKAYEAMKAKGINDPFKAERAAVDFDKPPTNLSVITKIAKDAPEVLWLVVDSVNTLEQIGATCNSGVLDDEFAFNSIGVAYCKAVEDSHHVIALMVCDETPHHYNNLLECYQRWVQKIEAVQLETSRNKLSDEQRKIANKLKEIRCPSVGVIGLN